MRELANLQEASRHGDTPANEQGAFRMNDIDGTPPWIVDSTGGRESSGCQGYTVGLQGSGFSTPRVQAAALVALWYAAGWSSQAMHCETVQCVAARLSGRISSKLVL